MLFQTRTAEQIGEWIRHRAIEIAVGEGDTIDPPRPGIVRLRDPIEFGRHWVLADFQNIEGLAYVRVAAAEASAKFDLPKAE